MHIVRKPDAPQSELRVGHVGPPRLTTDYVPIVLCSAILGGLFSSQLNLNLRDKRACTYGDETIHLFRAYDLTRGESSRDIDEFITVEVVPLTSALEMIRDGRIKDAKTALGILYAAGFRVGA